MSYLPRYLIISDGCTFHVTWQCHNKDWLLKWDWAKQLYYDLLLKYKDRHGIQIYSYCLMDNHPHISGKLENKELFSAFFRVVNGVFARRVNKKINRRGQIVMDRFKSPAIEDDRHLLTVMTYGDLNPCRVGKTLHPRNYRWSSYAYYALGKEDPLITPAPSYLALGDTPAEREYEYRRMVDELLAEKKYINISNTYYIGNPDWVLKKYREMKENLLILILGAKKVSNPLQPPT